MAIWDRQPPNKKKETTPDLFDSSTSKANDEYPSIEVDTLQAGYDHTNWIEYDIHPFAIGYLFDVVLLMVQMISTWFFFGLSC